MKVKSDEANKKRTPKQATATMEGACSSGLNSKKSLHPAFEGSKMNYLFGKPDAFTLATVLAPSLFLPRTTVKQTVTNCKL
jgi:hypothetical protein